MDEILNINSIEEFNNWLGAETLHPLVSAFDLGKAEHPVYEGRVRMNFFCMTLVMFGGSKMVYGHQTYNYGKGTLMFIGPGQTVDYYNPERIIPKGWVLAFHPDLYYGMPLAKKMKRFTFFDYEVNEALHLTKDEQKLVSDILQHINYELHQPADSHTQALITEQIDLLLNYCVRFYERQFMALHNTNNRILLDFNHFLDVWFHSPTLKCDGLPTVKYFADKVHLSPNYFGDLIKKETGITAQEYIQQKLIDVAKDRVSDNDKTINEIAFELGFQYPHYFSRMFRKHTGMSPNEFRKLRTMSFAQNKK